jgi:type II restriction enzyme
MTPPIVKKNVDICLFDCRYDEYNDKIAKNGKKYLALGELKGGIDPAGADEHWKTANTALSRIRSSFTKIKMKPLTFFIGAAIEKSMAREIYVQLKKKTLSNAANLTSDFQLNSICHWICEI